MDTARIERRAGQRFDFQVPVSVQLGSGGRAGHGFTQNLSAKGLSICTDMPLSEADILEVTLVMPAEITMAESMRLRCRGQVLRVTTSGVATKYVAAVHLQRYEYLTDDAGFADLRKVSNAPSPVCEPDNAAVAP